MSARADIPLAMRVIDTHTEGEPTRVIVDGWPQPKGTTMGARRDDMRARFDHLRRAVVCEPRGHDAVVGALLTPPEDPASAAGIVFFNTGTYLGMCGHGLIGVVRALEYLGKLGVGQHRFDTPVGTVGAELASDGTVTIENVPARLQARDVSLTVPGYGTVVGDVAYGGNWFFVTHADPVPLALAHVRELTRFTHAVREALATAGVTGADGAEIDHIELSAPPTRADADARNYVLCSGGDYDRSPCGTGTSAVMAALHGRGELAIGAQWRQESITGSLFTGWLTQRADGALVPHVRGTAFVTADTTLRFDPRDPFRCGFGGS